MTISILIVHDRAPSRRYLDFKFLPALIALVFPVFFLTRVRSRLLDAFPPRSLREPDYLHSFEGRRGGP